MGQMLVVTMREGIEAFLIVAIAAAYLRKTGREPLLPAVWWGAGVAVLLSIVLGAFLAEYAVTPFAEGMLAVIAAALVISMVVYMLSAAKHMRREIGAKLETAAARDRKSTRLNSSHLGISYAVLCLKKINKSPATAARRAPFPSGRRCARATARRSCRRHKGETRWVRSRRSMRGQVRRRRATGSGQR